MATAQFLNWIERQGQTLRQKINASEDETLDPYRLASVMGACILGPHDTIGLTADDLDVLLGESSDHWSGGTLHLPDGRILVILNPTHAETRKRATLMEELAHVHLGHKPSQFIITNGAAMRSFSKSQETAASWVGAAALIPRSRLIYASSWGLSREAIAVDCGVSVKLVKFREGTTGIKLSC